MGDLYGIGSVADLQTLLRGLNLLGEKTSENSTAGNDDPGAQALESTVTKITALTAPAVTVLGGLATVGTGIATFWNKINGEVRVAVVWGLSIVIAVAALSLALIIWGDVRSRIAGQIAMYDARRQIAIAFLTRSVQLPPAQKISDGSTTLTAERLALIALAASHRDAPVTVPKGPGTLRGIDQLPGQGILLYVHLDAGGDDWVTIDEVELNEIRYPPEGGSQTD